MKIADLEIGLGPSDLGAYALDLRLALSDEGIERERDVVHFDFGALDDAKLDPAGYGQLLSQCLFKEPRITAVLSKALAASVAIDSALRVRLFISAAARRLHALRWETLRDPTGRTPLLVGDNVWFSRYLSSFEWPPVRLRRRTDLRAVIAIVNPPDLAAYGLASIDVARELDLARRALSDISTTALTTPAETTLDGICDAMREGSDILYLVCHGAVVNGESQIWLHGEADRAVVVKGEELAKRFTELQQRPRLVVLGSCQSAGDGDAELSARDHGMLAGIGPRLIEAGVPAVVAMQGNVRIRTVESFMPTFFQELRRDGLIDRAMAVARGRVRDELDGWMPVLFMRLVSGSLWYLPGFGTEKSPDFERWPAILSNIAVSKCTPIIGVGLLEPYVGPLREMARQWAYANDFPLSTQEGEDLARVAQFLAAVQQRTFPPAQFQKSLRGELVRRFSTVLGPPLQNRPLDDIIEDAAKWRRKRDVETHDVLASLPLPIFLTTRPDALLSRTLAAHNKQPCVELFRWRSEVDWPRSVYETDPSYVPTPDRPLVYHLFGTLDLPKSLVLTQDQYLEFLVSVTRKPSPLPGPVLRALADSGLLFLGYQWDEWDARVLLRGLLHLEGSQCRSDYAQVAVQVDPDQGRIIDVGRARRYLEKYFGEESLNIYWGSAEDFVRELAEKLPFK